MATQPIPWPPHEPPHDDKLPTLRTVHTIATVLHAIIDDHRHDDVHRVVVRVENVLRHAATPRSISVESIHHGAPIRAFVPASPTLQQTPDPSYTRTPTVSHVVPRARCAKTYHANVDRVVIRSKAQPV